MPATYADAFQFIWRDYTQPSYSGLILTLNLHLQSVVFLACLGAGIAATQTKWWTLNRWILIRVLSPIRLADEDDPLRRLSQVRAIRSLFTKHKLRTRNDTTTMVHVSPWFGATSLLTIVIFFTLGALIPYYLTGASSAAVVQTPSQSSCDGIWSYSTQSREQVDQYYRNCRGADRIQNKCESQTQLTGPTPIIHFSKRPSPWSPELERAQYCRNNETNLMFIEQTDLTPRTYGINVASNLRHSHRLACLYGYGDESVFWEALEGEFGTGYKIFRQLPTVASAFPGIHCLEQYKVCYLTECSQWTDGHDALTELWSILDRKLDRPTALRGHDEIRAHAFLILASSVRLFIQNTSENSALRLGCANFMVDVYHEALDNYCITGNPIGQITDSTVKKGYRWQALSISPAKKPSARELSILTDLEVLSWFELAWLDARFSVFMSAQQKPTYPRILNAFTEYHPPSRPHLNSNWTCGKVLYRDTGSNYININIIGLVATAGSLLVAWVVHYFPSVAVLVRRLWDVGLRFWHMVMVRLGIARSVIASFASWLPLYRIHRWAAAFRFPAAASSHAPRRREVTRPMDDQDRLPVAVSLANI